MIFGKVIDSKMKNGAIRDEVEKLEEKIYTEINSVLKKKRGLKKALSDHLEYAEQGSLTMALKNRSFKLGALLEMMYFLDIKPMNAFTDKTRLNIEKLSLYELVRKITSEILKEHIEDKHIYDEDLKEIIENNNKK